MPEICEIALTSEILQHYFKNKLIKNIQIINKGKYASKMPDGYDEISGVLKKTPLRIKKISSKGKFMWFALAKQDEEDSSYYIWNTFGLSGVWSINKPASDHNIRVVINLTDNKSLYYLDVINYGTFKFSSDKSLLLEKLKSFGQDVLRTVNLDYSEITKFNKLIAEVLMDQTKIVCGIGNYLVAEILYKAKISPFQICSKMTDQQIKDLTYATKYIVKLAYIDNHTKYMGELNKIKDVIPRRNYHPDIKLNEKSFEFKVYGYNNTANSDGCVIKTDKIIKSGNSFRTTFWCPSVQLKVD
jgi:formamidopyrimidine-DNA glycosylase